MPKDWIPGSQQGFKDLVEKTISSLITNKDKFGFGDATDNGKWLIKEVSPAYSNFNESFRVWKDKDTRTNLASLAITKDREVLEKLYRRLARILKDSISVSDVELGVMGIPPRHEGAGTPSRTADEEPEIEAEIVGKGRICAHFFPKGGKRGAAKLEDQHGVEFWWVVLPEQKMLFIDELVHSEFSTRSPYTFKLSDRQSGQFLYFAGRWENTRTDKGPWSRIICVVIP
jgi:hypothetical protein